MAQSHTILLVDDEPQIRRALRTPLVSRGYAILEARTGEEALERLRTEKADLVVLDLNMPGIGGLETCRQIRAGSDVPIIVLSVRSEEQDKISALDAGADDYVVKPFSVDELAARIRANLRRSASGSEPEPIATEQLRIDLSRRQVHAYGKDVHLTPKEFDLLRALIASEGTPVSHRHLLQTVWGPEYGEQTEYLRVFINQLRKKIERDPAEPAHILTEPWVGYRFQR